MNFSLTGRRPTRAQHSLPEVAVIFYLRLSLGLGFLSAVADRLSIWGAHGSGNVAWGNMHYFIAYTAELIPWLSVSLIPSLAWVVTLLETALGIFLILGLWIRWTALASGILTLLFALAMTASLGIHAPLNYSVFVCSAASFLLSMAGRYPHKDSSPVP